jgi:molybdopterin molybdotransferase
MRKGDVVVIAGQRLRPADTGVLAATGHEAVTVRRRPVVAICSTGNELAGLDRFDEVRAGRRIANSNGYALAAAVSATGAEPLQLGIARDSMASLLDRFSAALDADVLVATAGASVGDHDLVKDALEQLGMETVFWRVLMKPGSPASFGVIRRTDRSDLLVFNLPGNPVSALVTFEVLVRPALRRLAGRRALFTKTSRVRLGEPLPATGRLTHFVRARLDEPSRSDDTASAHFASDAADGSVAADVDLYADAPVARLTGPQGSGILTSMSRADALVVVAPGPGPVPAGTAAVAIRLDLGDAAQSHPGYGLNHGD